MIKIPRASVEVIDRNRKRRPANWDGASHCLVCDSPITHGAHVKIIHVIRGGGWVGTDDEAAELGPDGDCGGWPVGMTCYRNHPELAPYAIDIKAY